MPKTKFVEFQKAVEECNNAYLALHTTSSSPSIELHRKNYHESLMRVLIMYSDLEASKSPSPSNPLSAWGC